MEGIMMRTRERRLYERYDDMADIVFSASGPGKYRNAKMHNCSMGGMYFNSWEKIDEGRSVCVKMLGYPSVFSAEVVRCKAMDIDGKICYGIGIQYSEPI